MKKLTGTDKAVLELKYVHENVGYVHKTAKQTKGIKPHLHLLHFISIWLLKVVFGVTQCLKWKKEVPVLTDIECYCTSIKLSKYK